MFTVRQYVRRAQTVTTPALSLSTSLNRRCLASPSNTPQGVGGAKFSWKRYRESLGASANLKPIKPVVPVANSTSTLATKSALDTTNHGGNKSITGSAVNASEGRVMSGLSIPAFARTSFVESLGNSQMGSEDSVGVETAYRAREITNPLEIDVVFYHAPCMDGITAAAAAYLRLGKRKVYKGVTHSYVPDYESLVGQNVALVDVCFSPDVMHKLARVCDGLIILDHHISAQKALAESGFPAIYQRFDLHMSGASLAWRYFHPKVTPPPLIKYVEDRDNWRFKYANTTAVAAALLQEPPDIPHFASLLLMTEDDIAPLKARGRKLHATQRLTHYALLANTRLCRFKPTGDIVLAVPTPGHRSDIGNILALNPSARFAVLYSISNGGDYIVSLRSSDQQQLHSFYSLLHDVGEWQRCWIQANKQKWMESAHSFITKLESDCRLNIDTSPDCSSEQSSSQGQPQSGAPSTACYRNEPSILKARNGIAVQLTNPIAKPLQPPTSAAKPAGHQIQVQPPATTLVTTTARSRLAQTLVRTTCTPQSSRAATEQLRHQWFLQEKYHNLRHEQEHERRMQQRTKRESPADVAAIAASLGGGGHLRAAAFKWRGPLRDLLEPLDGPEELDAEFNSTEDDVLRKAQALRSLNFLRSVNATLERQQAISQHNNAPNHTTGNEAVAVPKSQRQQQLLRDEAIRVKFGLDAASREFATRRDVQATKDMLTFLRRQFESHDKSLLLVEDANIPELKEIKFETRKDYQRAKELSTFRNADDQIFFNVCQRLSYSNYYGYTPETILQELPDLTQELILQSMDEIQELFGVRIQVRS